MRGLRIWMWVSVAAVLAGCASKPPAPVSLRQETLRSGSGRVGVVMTALPKVDTHLPGANCLLCMAVAAGMNSSLTTHARTLPYEDLPQLKEEVAKRLRQQGVEVVVIGEPIDPSSFADLSSTTENASRKDFSSLGRKYQIDKLVVLQIDVIGFQRNYSAYVPTSDPKALLRGAGYMVNLKSQIYEWYAPVDVLRSAGDVWDEPPKFPGLTNAYFQALELGSDQFVKPFER